MVEVFSIYYTAEKRLLQNLQKKYGYKNIVVEQRIKNGTDITLFVKIQS